MKHALCSLTLVSLVMGGCSGGGTSSPTVVAAVYPLAFLAEEVAGGGIEVQTLTPAGAEPHDLELTPSQARAIAEASLVIYVGDGFQPAVEDAVRQSGNGLDVLDIVEPEDHADESDDHPDGGTDPHVWLDPLRAAELATAIAERLDEVEPDAMDGTGARLEELVGRLDELDRAFTEALSGCATDTFVVSHEAFGYLTERYALRQVGIAGINPEQEPSPQRLAEVARFVSDEQIETIFLERLVPSEIGETLARETGAEIAALDPLEIAPEQGDYFTAMTANRDALAEGLGCSSGI